jgi:hypothetical protein
VAADRLLPEPLSDRERRLDRVVRRELGADDLDERHQRRRVEEVHADDAARCRDGCGDLRHGQRRRVRREDRVRPDDALQLGEELELGAEVLHDRLDDEVAVGEVRQVGGE